MVYINCAISYNQIMNKISWIFFDIGGVLVDDSEYEQLRIDTLYKTIKIFDSTTSRKNILDAIPKASSMTGLLNDNILNIFLRDKQKLYMAKNLIASKRHALSEAAANAKVRPETKNVLSELSKNFQLGLIANQPKSTRESLEEADILQYFSHSLMSEDHGYRKPDLRYFKSVLDDCDTEPEKSAIIDNNIERGLLPAKKIGMTTVWYRLPDKKYIENSSIDYTISNLSELTNIFK